MKVDDAIGLAQAGVPVFPCGADKRPLVKHGFEDASSDPATVRSWWERWPDALIAVPTGQPSGLWVADLDVDKETGECTGEAACADLGLTPPAWVVRTRTGGSHWLYRWRDGLPGNTAKRLPGLDSRGLGGYVVAWEPQVLLGAAADEALPEPPEVLLKAMERPTPKPNGAAFRVIPGGAGPWAEAAMAAEAEAVAHALPGQRNDTLNKAAFSLAQIAAGGHIDLSRVESTLITAAIASGLTLTEAARTIQSGIAAGAATPRGPLMREPEPLPRRNVPRMVNGPDAPPEPESEPEPDHPTVDTGKPAFNVMTPRRHGTCEEVRKLLAAHHSLFAFGGVLVEVDHSPAAGLYDDTSKTVPAKFPHPVAVTKDRVVGHIERVCKWQAKVDTPKFSGWIDKPVPDWSARLIALGSAQLFPPLAGVIRHPVLDAENRLRSGFVGYDPKSQYFIQAPLEHDINEFTWTSPAAALEWLTNDWLSEFCWSTPADALRAVMLCLTLLKARTTLARNGKFPGFLITAPMASTGKTELVECLTRAVTGEGIPFSAFPIDDDAEMNKLLMSIVMSDPSCFCFDNIKNGHSIRSAVLDQFITRDSFQGRLLGTNRIGDFPSLAVVIATGNNIEAAEDSATRFLEIRLQPKDDNPQNAVFLHDAKARTVELRPRILSALREIARHQHTVPQKGRFRAWFKEVAGPVMDLSNDRGLLDAWDQVGSTIRNADALEDFLAKVKSTGIDPISASEIVSLAFNEYAALVGVKQDLYDAIMSSPDPADIDGIKRREAAKTLVARFVGTSLKPWRDQMAGGMRLRLVKCPDAKGRQREHVSLSGRNPFTRSSEEGLF